jgi:hypothetical protein
VLISSRGERALITGDSVHSPVQFAQPGWYAGIDVDRDLSCRTRRQMVGDYADSGVLIIGTHFAPPTAGYLATTPAGVRFEPLRSSTEASKAESTVD